MATDLGDPYPITVETRDDDLNLANTDSVFVTITLPDGTALAAAEMLQTGLGVYEYNYATTVAGLHSWEADASGPIEGVFSDTFTVTAPTEFGIVSLEDARAALRMGDSNTAQDELIRDIILDVSDLCEAYTGQVWRRTVVLNELSDGGATCIQLRKMPVTSVTSVTESGTSVDASAYVLDGFNGWLWRGTSLTPRNWATGRLSVSVSYVAGPVGGIVPRRIRRGALNFIRHMWEERRAGTGIPFQAGPDTEWAEANGVQIPRRVAESWDLARIDGIA